MTIRDQQFDEDGQYVARRDFVMGGHQYTAGDPVPLDIARQRGPDHPRKLYVARLIRPADVLQTNGHHFESSGDWTKPPEPQPVTVEVTGDGGAGGVGGSAACGAPDLATLTASGQPAAETKKTEPERLPGGTTTRYIEHTGRGWFRVIWDGTETKVRGAEAAAGIFDNLKAQDGMQRGETVVAADAPEGAGGEAPREDPAQLAPWIEDGKDQTDLP